MNRTIQLRLITTPEQDAVLAETLDYSRECFNYVARYGWDTETKNGVTLHNATYYDLRAGCPRLPAQLIVSARMKATEALVSAFALKKKGRRASQPEARSGSIRYDARTYRMETGSRIVGLSTTAGRQKFPFTLCAHSQRWLDRAKGYASAELVKRPSGWWLNVVLDISAPDIERTGEIIGVDLGINRPAVTSDAKFLGERRWKDIEKKYFRLKRKLQAKGTLSAKRHLKKMARRQGRFRKDCDHVLSKRIVQSVQPGSVIVVENLTGIRKRTKQRSRQQRRRHHGWSYAQLRTFLEYKAEEIGAEVVAVDPRKTSQRCSKCGHVHRGNRISQSDFRCRECGYRLNADFNAARNIAWKYLVGTGMSGSGGLNVTQPIVGRECSHDLTHKPPALAGGS